MSEPVHLCEARVWHSFSTLMCSKHAKVQRDGKWFCGIHDPEAIKEREAKRLASRLSKQEEKRKSMVYLRDHAPDGSTCTLWFKGELKHYREVE